MFSSLLIYLKVDGTAALVVLVEHDTPPRLIVANSGDQRAVLARGNVCFFHFFF